MKLTRRIAPYAGAVLLACGHYALADHEDGLPFSYPTDNYGYTIYFDQSNPYACPDDEADIPDGADRTYFPFSQVLLIADALDSNDPSVPGFPAGYHVGYTDLGFRAPDYKGEDDEVFIYDCAPGGVHDDADCDNGMAGGQTIKLPSTRYCAAAEISLRRVTGHELFHHVQFGYDGGYSTWGKVPYEGTARMMEDQIYADIDAAPNSAFISEAKKYLDNPNQDFWTSSYQSALGWKHLAEQFGTTNAEPQRGVDFIRQLWDNIDAIEDPDVPGAIQQTIDDLGGQTDLREWFQNFTIANIAKEFDTSALPDSGKYDYIDLNDGNGTTLAAVKRATDPADTIPGTLSGTSYIQRWGAEYLDVAIGSSCFPGDFVGVALDKVDRIAYTILPVVDGKVTQLLQGASSNFGAAFVQGNPGAADYYDQLLVVMTGADAAETVDWSFDCGPGALDILNPDSTYQAFVGPNDDPREVIVRMNVTGPQSLGTPTVLGLQPEDFEVYIGNFGNAPDEAEVITGAYVQGEYWLTVQAPEKPDENSYDLHVMYGGSLADMNVNAVSYETRRFDNMLVIDRSGSMGDPVNTPKIDAAKNASRFFADIAHPDLDKIGLVSFSGNNSEPDEDSTLDEPLDDATDNHRDDVKAAISAIAEGGNTSVGDGLNRASQQFPLAGSVEGEDWITLLSDGMENEALFWTDVQAGIKAAGIRVNTIALGADADQVLLQQIADETNGTYYYVDVGTAGGGLAPMGLTPAAETLANRLADTFVAADERMRGHERLWETGARSGSQGDTWNFVVPIAGEGIEQARMMFNWTDAAHEVDVIVRRPDGTAVRDGVNGAEVIQDDTHIVFHLGHLDSGDWTVEVEALSGDPDYIGILSGDDRRGARLNAFMAQYQNELGAELVGAKFLRGLPQTILAELSDRSATIRDAEVRARIEHPDGTIIDLPLYDDGAHDDGWAQDGVYGNAYTRTTEASDTDLADAPGNGTRGSYNVVVEATGKDNRGDSFERLEKLSFQIYEVVASPLILDPDTDGDGMPDRYEDLHACLDSLVVDGLADADDNGLSNFDEWDAGLNPCDEDTDRGGETDVSELDRGANPFDPADDRIVRPIDAEVVDYRYEHIEDSELILQAGANVIRYQVDPSHVNMRILRSTDPAGPFSEIALVLDPDGLYTDAGLTNGVTYYYKVQPIGSSGQIGAASHVFSGTPNSDPIPPIGSVLINGGDGTTTSNLVKLSLVGSSDTVQMQISNDPTLDGAPLVGFQHSVNWMLEPDGNGVAHVFVKLFDAAGNGSPTVYHAAIEVVDAMEIATLQGNATLQAADDHAGIVVQVVGRSGNAPAFTEGGGDYTLELTPGTYDIKLSYAGYEDHIFRSVVAGGGDLIAMQDIVLNSVDADLDQVPDLIDNCTLVANEDQRNTDGDAYGNLCDADLTGDEFVDLDDFQILRDAVSNYNEDADFDGDGAINISDAWIFRGQWMGPPGPAGPLP